MHFATSWAEGRESQSSIGESTESGCLSCLTQGSGSECEDEEVGIDMRGRMRLSHFELRIVSLVSVLVSLELRVESLVSVLVLLELSLSIVEYSLSSTTSSSTLSGAIALASDERKSEGLGCGSLYGRRHAATELDL